jgi:hypothetical protein
MGKVHRNGIPPKRFQQKMTQSMSDFDWYEDRFLAWAKESCVGSVQYDVVVFQGPNRMSPKTVELIVWFEKKKDAMMFKLGWMA